MTPPQADDPRALAQKLAEEAKARALAKQLAETAKARAAASAEPAPEPAAPKKSLADRARKPMSAKEALRRAIAAEKAAAAAPAPAPAAAPPVAPMAAPAPRAAAAVAPAPAAAPTTPSKAVPVPAPATVPLKDGAKVVAERLPGLEAGELHTVDNREVFRALWMAHRARARSEGDLQLMITADVLTAAAERLPVGALLATRVTRGDDTWAAWIDASAGIVLGLAAPADIYLAGL